MWRELRCAAVWRRACLTCGLAAMLGLALCASALAAGKAVNIATPFDIQPYGPSVAVDSGGNAIIAWANQKDLAGAPDLVQYCVVPAGGSTCAHSGSLTAADSAGHVDGVRVLDDSGTLVILADVFGAAGNNAGDYTPEQEWQSTDDGASWTQQATGLSVSSGIVSADTVPIDAVDRARHRGARLRVGHGRGRADVQRVPADRSARVLGGDVPSRLRDARARHEPRSARQRAGAFRVDLHRPARRGDGRVRQPGHQRPAGVRPELRHRVRLRRGRPVGHQQLQHLTGPAQQRVAGPGDPGRLQRRILGRGWRSQRFRDPGGRPRHEQRRLPPLRRRDRQVRHAAGDRQWHGGRAVPRRQPGQHGRRLRHLPAGRIAGQGGAVLQRRRRQDVGRGTAGLRHQRNDQLHQQLGQRQGQGLGGLVLQRLGVRPVLRGG